MFKDLFGGIGSAFGGIAGMFADDGEGDRYRQQILQEFRNLEDPRFNTDFIASPHLQEAASYHAEQFNPENRDHLLEVYREDPTGGRASQLENLAYLESVRDGGMSDLDRLAAMDAQRDVARSHSRAQQSIMRDLGARGMLGGGNEVLARQMAAQQAAELSRGLGADLARMSLERRMQGALAAGDQAQALRMGDFQVGQTRADTMNRWNQFMMDLLTSSNQANAQARERAGFQNTAARQGRADQNALMDFENKVGHRDLRNTLAQQQYDNRFGRANAVAGALGGLAQAEDARAAARRDTLQGLGTMVGGALGSGVDLYKGFQQLSAANQKPKKNPLEDFSSSFGGLRGY